MGFVKVVEDIKPEPEAKEACYCDLPTRADMTALGYGEGTIWQCSECGRVCVYVTYNGSPPIWRDSKTLSSWHKRLYLTPKAKPFSLFNFLNRK